MALFLPSLLVACVGLYWAGAFQNRPQTKWVWLVFLTTLVVGGCLFFFLGGSTFTEMVAVWIRSDLLSVKARAVAVSLLLAAIPEELLKGIIFGAVLYAARNAALSPPAIVRIAIACGLGFGLMENSILVHEAARKADWLTHLPFAIQRTGAMIMHLSYALVLGAGGVCALRDRKPLYFVVGWLAAIFLHFFWDLGPVFGMLEWPKQQDGATALVGFIFLAVHLTYTMSFAAIDQIYPKKKHDPQTPKPKFLIPLGWFYAGLSVLWIANSFRTRWDSKPQLLVELGTTLMTSVIFVGFFSGRQWGRRSFLLLSIVSTLAILSLTSVDTITKVLILVEYPVVLASIPYCFRKDVRAYFAGKPA